MKQSFLIRVLWLGFFLLVTTYCGRPVSRPTAITAANNQVPVEIFPSPVPTISPLPTATPIVEPSVSPVPYFANGAFLAEANPALLEATGLGAFLAFPKTVPGTAQIFECRQAPNAPTVLLTKSPARCAGLGLVSVATIFLPQSASSSAAHYLRGCFNPRRNLFYTKLGGNRCDELPAANPAFSQSFTDSVEVELLGYASTTGYVLQ